MSSQATQTAPNEPVDSPILKFRIEGIRESAKRARIAFLASIIASLCIFVAEYNAYLSWYFWRISLTPDAEKTGLFKTLPDLYAQNTVINISLLGIRIGEGDLVILGSLALLVFSLWLFFSLKSYSGLITGLLKDTQKSSPDIKMLVFSGIYSFLLFTTATLYDGLRPGSHNSGRLQRVIVTALYALPAAAVVFVLLTDALSLFFLPAPFTVSPYSSLWSQLTPALRRTAGIFISIGFVILWLVVYPLKKIVHFDRSTASLLRDYQHQSADPAKTS